MAMMIQINGKAEQVHDDMSISDLLEAKKIRPEVVTVELNDKVVERGKYKDIVLSSHDRLEFVYYMGGGGWQLPNPHRKLHYRGDCYGSKACK